MTTEGKAMQLTIEVNVGLVVRCGDVLVVGLDYPGLTMEQADELRVLLLKRLPGLADVVFITHATTLAAYRPDAVAGAEDHHHEQEVPADAP